MTYAIGDRVAHTPTGTRGTICEAPPPRAIDCGPGQAVIETPAPDRSVWVRWDDTGQPACMALNFVQPAIRAPRRERQDGELRLPWGNRLRVREVA